MFGGGFQATARGMDHRHRILNRDGLRPARLHIEFRSPKARQNKRLLCDQQMRAVELGRDMDRKVKLSHRLERSLGIGDRYCKVAAKANQSLGMTVADRLDGFD